MSQRIIIAIEVPDGVSVKVSHASVEPVEEPGFGTEPLPVETFAGEETWVQPIAAPTVNQPAPQTVTPFRTAATQPQAPIGYRVGEVHVQGHKPLKFGRDGRSVYCPTAVGKGPDGKAIFCDFKAALAS